MLILCGAQVDPLALPCHLPASHVLLDGTPHRIYVGYQEWVDYAEEVGQFGQVTFTEVGRTPHPESADATARRFLLVRHHDVSGVSGTGVVAQGVEWPDGAVTIRWAGQHASTVCWDSLADAMAIHGHAGATTVTWLDTNGALQ